MSRLQIILRQAFWHRWSQLFLISAFNKVWNRLLYMLGLACSMRLNSIIWWAGKACVKKDEKETIGLRQEWAGTLLLWLFSKEHSDLFMLWPCFLFLAPKRAWLKKKNMLAWIFSFEHYQVSVPWNSQFSSSFTLWKLFPLHTVTNKNIGRQISESIRL